ncbi:MAG: hypothetical protein JSU98_17230 [Gemmatimonadales bacterium]|nr:MAG: hypothetical protein JSU98_17230 [Gemmatimonadales bacterium]
MASIPSRLRFFGPHNLEEIPQVSRLSADDLVSMKAVSAVLPFRVNEYVVNHLIDWERVPEDPMFQLTFPQRGMLSKSDHDYMVDLVRSGAPRLELRAAARPIQMRLNPHPAGQLSLNVPMEGGERLPGIQHKYRETVLLFPTPGQTCHSYCSYCFRWAQFVGVEDLKFASKEPQRLAAYIRGKPDVSDVLFTGGDPMVMKTHVLRRYVEPLLDIEHVATIRIGTKSLAYWPHRFVHDDDADDLLRLFEEIRERGKQIALMGHYSHWVELETDVARQAIERVRSAGAVVRTQAPLIRHVNDDPEVWTRMWRTQVRLGAVPYYMFVERDTGPSDYFSVPLAGGLAIYESAYRRVSGLGRTARGPSMSCTPGKILVDGVAEVAGEKVFALKMLQGRDPEWVNRIAFAKYDAEARWIDDLQPAFGASEFFWDADPECSTPLRREPTSKGRIPLKVVGSSDRDDGTTPLRRVGS